MKLEEDKVNREEEVFKIIYDAIDEINLQLPPEKRVEKSNDTILFGPLGQLDSLSLLNLIVAIEMRIKEKIDISVDLVDEGALSQHGNSFKSIGSLSEHISLVLYNATNSK